MNTVRTVSETKRSFYTLHTRPVHSIYRRVVEELMVEMHLLSVNANFRYDPIYALGVVSSFNQFMQGYRPEADKDSIFSALCQALGNDAQQYQQDAAQLEAMAQQLSAEELVTKMSQPGNSDIPANLQAALQQISENAQFKYSRLFAIGLFTLLELADSELVKDETRRLETLKQLCEALHLPIDKLQKDLDLYRSNLEKMAQARLVMEDLLKADRKQQEKRAQEKNAVATTQEAAPDTSSS
ncbi:MAG: photosystem II biogenesis protein Psp29 [Leptolyngbyaceae bacterium]|nr:photosystem II biogenesis protein Psp29 [Leptolyngbyaceae bacterium]